MSRLSLTTSLLALFIASGSAVSSAETSPPNVLLVILDDQNSFAGRTDLAPEPVSPNLNRLAARGVTFTNAHCAAPVCNPSRTALLSGLRPSTTGIYDNDQDSTPASHILTRTKSLPAYFHDRGYITAGGGKIFGSSFGSLLKGRVWDESPDRKKGGEFKHDPRPTNVPVNGFGKHDWAPSPVPRDQLEDWRLGGWAAEFLAKPHSKPFFLAVGIVKPHTPWYVPKEYFDRFPPAKIELPNLSADEYAGIPLSVRDKIPKIEAQLVARRKELVAAYLASSRYADDCLGRVLEGLHKGPHRDNTIVVVCGDNGYEFGEKHHWSKGSLREGSAHVPLVIAAPGFAKGLTSTRAVSLLDVYPTLLDLAGLPAKADNEGASLVPLLKNPMATWDYVAVTTKGFRSHSVRTERWRYIRYSDGEEELYDHDSGPLERSNLASNAEFVVVKDKMRKWLPKHDEPRNPNTNGKGDD